MILQDKAHYSAVYQSIVDSIVCKSRDKWWFWREDWVYWEGPFDSELFAVEALKEYAVKKAVFTRIDGRQFCKATWGAFVGWVLSA